MNGLNSLGWKIHDHLKQYRPTMFHDLKNQGRLMQYVESLQKQADERMTTLEERGYQTHEAWEIVSPDVMLPSEEDVPTLGETIQPYSG